MSFFDEIQHETQEHRRYLVPSTTSSPSSPTKTRFRLDTGKESVRFQHSIRYGLNRQSVVADIKERDATLVL